MTGEHVPAAGSALLHVVIPSYNGGGAILRCIASVLRATYRPLRLIVVDNASSDGTVREIARRFPASRLVRNPCNLGFSGACNAGIDAARRDGADLILILNQDTVIHPELPAILAGLFRRRPRAGAAGPKTYFGRPAAGAERRLLYGGAWRGRLPLRQCLPGIGKPDVGGRAGAARVDYVWGHGMMLRAEALVRVGGFDPGFFMYFEDLDLCRRMAATGYEVWYVPAAVMWHDITDGARAIHSERWRWVEKMRSMRHFHRKHYGPAAARALNALTALAEIERLVWRGHLRAARHLLAAYVVTFPGACHAAEAARQ